MEHDPLVRTESEQQAIQDNYLIDHLINAFQPEPARSPNGARATIAAPVYDHIRDSWGRVEIPVMTRIY